MEYTCHVAKTDQFPFYPSKVVVCTLRHTTQAQIRNGGNGSCSSSHIRTVRKTLLHDDKGWFGIKMDGTEMGKEKKNQQEQLTSTRGGGEAVKDTTFAGLHFHRPTPRRSSTSPRPLRHLQPLLPPIPKPPLRTRTSGYSQAPHCSVSQCCPCLCLLQTPPRSPR